MASDTARDTLPRLLLVEDDAAIRQFVQMALEELPIRVQACGSLAAARAALAEPPPPFLVLLDLMLPDGRGPELIADPAVQRLADPPPWVVFSAGVQDAARAALQAQGVSHVLRKPVALDELVACVTRHLPSPAVARPAAATDPPDRAGAADLSLEDGSAPAEAWAIATFFEGQTALFEAMRSASRARLPQDRAALASALHRADLAQARRLAHNLRSALALIACPRAAAAATALEAALAAVPPEDWASAWNDLQARWPT